jgi:hypothetical protein
LKKSTRKLFTPLRNVALLLFFLRERKLFIRAWSTREAEDSLARAPGNGLKSSGANRTLKCIHAALRDGVAEMASAPLVAGDKASGHRERLCCGLA